MKGTNLQNCINGLKLFADTNFVLWKITNKLNQFSTSLP